MANGLSIGSLVSSGGGARLTGTSSKLDTEALVAAAYEAKRLPAVRLEQKIARNEARGAALGELRTLLQDLQASVAGLRNPPGFLGAADNVFEAKQAFLTGGATVPADELVGVTVENRAAAGTFTLEVTRLATAHKLAARPLGGADATLADSWNGGAAFAGSLRLGLAGSGGATIAVDGAMSADDLRAAINAVTAQTGVSASLLTVGPDDRRLVLSATQTGRAIELADAVGDGVTALLGATTLQAARTAQLTVDGLAVERASNRIDDLLPGVALDLYRAESGAAVTVKVEPALAAAKEQVLAFVDAYNGLRDFVARQTSVASGGTVAEDAVLFGDRTLRSLAQSLAGIVGGAVPGLPGGALATLRDVGITLEDGGRLAVDGATLDDRLLGRLAEVRRVFEFTSTASAPGLAVYARDNGLRDLAFSVAVTDADGDGRPEAASFDGVPALVEGGPITGAPGSAYAGLKLIWTGQGSATIELAVSPGLADQIYNAVEAALDPEDGAIQRELDDLGSVNDDHRQRIEAIEARAARAKELLIQRLGAMESALSLADTLLSQLRAQMDAMNPAN